MRKYIAEFIGTFILIFFACGTATVSGGAIGVTGVVGIALSFGLAIIALAYSIGQISGCHVNPAVSFAMLISKRMTLHDFLGYIIAQFLGATAGAGVLKYITTCIHITSDENPYIASSLKALGSNGYGDSSLVNINCVGAFITETILTFVFIFVILSVTCKPEYSHISGIIIGLTLTFVHLVGIPLTGTSVNPARSLGPAIFAGGDALSQLWVFLLAPFAGALIAAFLWMFLSDSATDLNEITE